MLAGAFIALGAMFATVVSAGTAGQIPFGDLRRAAELYGVSAQGAIVHGLGIAEHAHGTDGVRTLTNLAVLTGRVGTERGCGVNPLHGQNNVRAPRIWAQCGAHALRAARCDRRGRSR